jgi:3-hydroxy-9,10-secoandrosta-1,3,5(10)-triene-9,17-dione monooxygenase
MNDGRESQPSRRDRVLAAASCIAPGLRARSAEAALLHRISDASVRDIVDSGIHRVFQPARYGGYELDFAVQLDLGLALGGACASAAWVALFYAHHPYVVGMLAEAAQDDVWKHNADALIANAFFSEDSRCTPVREGFVLDGTWILSSGVDHADWNNLNVMVPQAGSASEHRFMMVPRADYRILDDWRASGLAGTGSHSIRLERVFVPEHRTLPTLPCRDGRPPATSAQAGSLYRLPLMAVLPAGAAVTAPGVAQGVLDDVCERIAGRRNVAGARIAEITTIHIRLAEAAAEIDAAVLLLRRDLEEIDRLAAAGELPSLQQRARYRRDWSYSVLLAQRAVDRLHPLLGARGLAEGLYIQRAWCDIHAQASHAALSWDIQAQHHGRALLGLPLADPRI